MHSASKYLGGNHDPAGDVICMCCAFAEQIRHTHIKLGSVLS
ncbi:hypothetical protein [Burkholderia multivorans]